MGDGFSLRYAEPKDAPAFAEWVAQNPHIPAEDAIESKNHKTAKTMVVEKDGVPVLFFPLWAIIQVGFLGFNPNSSSEDKLKALELGFGALCHFAKTYGINEAQFTTNAEDEYPMLRWGRSKGLERLDKQVVKLRVKD